MSTQSSRLLKFEYENKEDALREETASHGESYSLNVWQFKVPLNLLEPLLKWRDNEMAVHGMVVYGMVVQRPSAR